MLYNYYYRQNRSSHAYLALCDDRYCILIYENKSGFGLYFRTVECVESNKLRSVYYTKISIENYYDGVK